jgi:CHAT domain-containing protein
VTGRYLVEDYVVAYAPSATIFALCSERARAKAGSTGEKLLSVGDPDFNHAKYPDLQDLPEAAEEAIGVAGLYESVVTLTGINATKSRTVAEMERSEVVHLALHSLVDERSPLQSKLLLAGAQGGPPSDGDSPGDLHAYEIYQMKLARTRLVVLSACRTGAGLYYDGEGVFSLARPFVGAGVPLVVASLWPVDSRATARLMIKLHTHRRHGMTPTAEALRMAQLDLLRGGDSRLREPYYWASFMAVGGHAGF